MQAYGEILVLTWLGQGGADCYTIVRSAISMRSDALNLLPHSDRGQRIHFLETLHALAGRVAGVNLPADEEFTIHDRMMRRLPRDELPPKFTIGGMKLYDIYTRPSVGGPLSGRPGGLDEFFIAQESALTPALPPPL